MEAGGVRGLPAGDVEEIGGVEIPAPDGRVDGTHRRPLTNWPSGGLDDLTERPNRCSESRGRAALAAEPCRDYVFMKKMQPWRFW